MPFGFGHTRKRRDSSYVAPPVTLSSHRVDANYTQAPRSASMTTLSGAAAAAALRNNSSSMSRTNSLTSRNFRSGPTPVQQQQHRANSLSGWPSYTHGQQDLGSPFRAQQRASSMRTLSMTSKSSARDRPGSSGGSTTVTTRQGNTPNTVIRISRQIGPDGRTKSLTKETITKMGSFEVVKTKTIKAAGSSGSVSPHAHQRVPVAPSAIYAGSMLSAGDSELNNIAEEFDMDYYIEQSETANQISGPDTNRFLPASTTSEERYDSNHAYRQLTQSNLNSINTSPAKKSSLKSTADQQPKVQDEKMLSRKKKRIHHKSHSDADGSDSGDSVYSDAFDLLPSSASQKARKSIMKPVDAESNSSSRQQLNSLTSSTRKSVRIDAPEELSSRNISPRLAQGNFAPVPRASESKELSPDQMYLKALEVARQRVYGNRDDHEEDEGYNSDSSFQRVYSKADGRNNNEHRFTMRVSEDDRYEVDDGRHMSLGSTSQMRTSSLRGDRAHWERQQQQANNHDTYKGLQKRSSVMELGHEGKVDKKKDKKQRKEYMKMLEQERRDAAVLASQSVGVDSDSLRSTQNTRPEQQKKKPAFSFFGKKPKKTLPPIVDKKEVVYAHQTDSPLEVQSNISKAVKKTMDRSHQSLNESNAGVGMTDRNKSQDTNARVAITTEVKAMEVHIPDSRAPVSNDLENSEEDTFIDAPLSPVESRPRTPTFSASNQPLEENSSEPKTIEDDDLVQKNLQYEPYEEINRQITNFSKSPQKAGEKYIANAKNSPTKAKQAKPKKDNKKTFGKKVLGWFDLDD